MALRVQVVKETVVAMVTLPVTIPVVVAGGLARLGLTEQPILGALVERVWHLLLLAHL